MVTEWKFMFIEGFCGWYLAAYGRDQFLGPLPLDRLEVEWRKVVSILGKHGVHAVLANRVSLESAAVLLKGVPKCERN